ncbi:MAG: alpha/beta fold hydrolase [Candidatus Neomarinimicrobiota bacterium]|nr:alpha/beta fold hydrolase [Candidatus Neomarinimicrobiota bacterium]
MNKVLKISGIILGSLGFIAGIWFSDLGGIKSKVYVGQIVKMRVSPKRLSNLKMPSDYGMDYKDIDIITNDQIRLSAWEIPSKIESNKTIIVNHPLTTTRYGSEEGLDGVSVEFLPMIRHLHDAGYNVVMYDHRGQGDSDGGFDKTLKGKEAPVGAGVTEWQDVVASVKYVNNHPLFKNDNIALLSQCMGANATFLAWRKETEFLKNSNISCMVAIQPTVSYNMIDRFIKIKTKMDLVDAVEAEQKKQFGFGYANSVEDIKSLTVPVLFSQVRKDQYTFNESSNKNDIEEIISACPTNNEVVWVGPDEKIPFGTGKRFEGYGYFNKYPEELLSFLKKNM